MPQHRFKRIRVALSLTFFILTTLLYLDFRNWYSPTAGTTVMYLQFVPLNWNFPQSASIAATGFIVVLLATIAIGRIYCSTICPLGFLQDLITSTLGDSVIRKSLVIHAA